MESFFSPVLYFPHFMSEVARRSRDTRAHDWTHVLDMRRFAPSEIQVKVDEDRVLVFGRHDEVSGENQDTYETKRVLKIPDDVDKEKLTTRVTEGRSVVVTAPYLRKEVKKVKDSNSNKIVPKLPTTYEVVEREDGKKEFQLKIQMADFTDQQLSIRTSDNTVYIDGENEWGHEGMRGIQKIHRQFTVPGVGEMGEAKALKDDSGILTVRIPLKSEEQVKGQIIPIQQG